MLLLGIRLVLMGLLPLMQVSFANRVAVLGPSARAS
jgi:hypothetical protein